MKGESEEERTSRNWDELLQELRVTQTGTQIFAGFLLTLVFTSRFSDLDDYQRTIHLCLFAGALLATVLGLAPVSMHRRYFRQGRKPHIVGLANRFLQAALLVLALVLAGTVLFIFDIVVGLIAGVIAGVVTAVALVTIWLVLPATVRVRLPDHGGRSTSPPAPEG